jgi:ribosomal subunit interface protein
MVCGPFFLVLGVIRHIYDNIDFLGYYMDKFSIDFNAVERDLNQTKIYRLADVQDRLERVAFDVVRFRDDDDSTKLWQIQDTVDGKVIVAIYNNDKPEELKSESEWQVIPDKQANIHVFKNGEPLVRVAAQDLGIPDDEVTVLARWLPEKLASDPEIREIILNGGVVKKAQPAKEDVPEEEEFEIGTAGPAEETSFEEEPIEDDIDISFGQISGSSEALEQHVRDGINKLRKFFKSPIKVRVALSQGRRPIGSEQARREGTNVAHGSITSDGETIHAEGDSDDMYDAVDEMLAKLHRQLRERSRFSRTQKRRHGRPEEFYGKPLVGKDAQPACDENKAEEKTSFFPKWYPGHFVEPGSGEKPVTIEDEYNANYDNLMSRVREAFAEFMQNTGEVPIRLSTKSKAGQLLAMVGTAAEYADKLSPSDYLFKEK